MNHVFCLSDISIDLDENGLTTFILAYKDDTSNIFTCQQNPDMKLALFLKLHCEDDMRLGHKELRAVNLFFGVKIIYKGPSENRA